MKNSRSFAAKILVVLLPATGIWGDRTEAVIYPVSSSLDLHAEANTGAGLVQDNNAMGQTTGLNALSASVLALLQNVSARELFWKKNCLVRPTAHFYYKTPLILCNSESQIGHSRKPHSNSIAPGIRI